MSDSDHVDVIDMELSDPTLRPVDGRGVPVPPGTYQFEISSTELGQSEKGNNVLRIEARIMTPGESEGRTMRRSYALIKSDFHRGRIKALIDATGAVLDENGAFSRQDLEGRRFVADVVSRSYEALDTRGEKVMRESSEWVGERSMDAPVAAVAAAAPAQGSAPAKPAAGRRPSLPVNGGARK